VQRAYKQTQLILIEQLMRNPKKKLKRKSEGADEEWRAAAAKA